MQLSRVLSNDKHESICMNVNVYRQMEIWSFYKICHLICTKQNKKIKDIDLNPIAYWRQFKSLLGGGMWRPLPRWKTWNFSYLISPCTEERIPGRAVDHRGVAQPNPSSSRENKKPQQMRPWCDDSALCCATAATLPLRWCRRRTAAKRPMHAKWRQLLVCPPLIRFNRLA